MIFDAYAEVYDLLNAGKDYPGEAAYVLARIAADRPLAIAEIGCGSGRHALAFAAAGHRVDAADPSPAMLRLAEARRSGAPPAVAGRLAFTAASTPPGTGYDVVVSLFHVASYAAAGAGGICAFAATAAALLRPGGHLFFDWWHGPGVIADPPRVRIRRARGGGHEVVRIGEPEHDATARTVLVRFHAFHRPDGGAWQDVREDHLLRYLSVDEVADALGAAGFTGIRTTAWREERAPDGRDWYACTSAVLGAGR